MERRDAKTLPLPARRERAGVRVYAEVDGAAPGIAPPNSEDWERLE
jgi:hypothetical protein